MALECFNEFGGHVLGLSLDVQSPLRGWSWSWSSDQHTIRDNIDRSNRGDRDRAERLVTSYGGRYFRTDSLAPAALQQKGLSRH